MNKVILISDFHMVEKNTEIETQLKRLNLVIQNQFSFSELNLDKFLFFENLEDTLFIIDAKKIKFNL